MASRGRLPNTATKLGSRIAQSGLPVYTVAGMTHISYTYLIAYVNMKRDIPIHHLNKLADFFECEPVELVGIVE